jgi:endonuclease III
LTVRDAIGALPVPAFFQRNLNPAEIPHHQNHWTMNPKSPKFSNGFEKSGRSFRKLSWDQPSPTVAYGHREMHVHPSGTRRVSIFEAMLLQGFPSTYQLLGNFSEQVEQVSNAVPPPLASALARSIQTSLYDRINRIQTQLLNWFEEHQRHFPWRETNDPYRILIAEKLLQQTAATPKVVQAYQEITQQYPHPNALAQASVNKLRKIIAPLGFNYRAAELPRLAQHIVELYEGRVPAKLDQLLGLPGLGDYSARAILAFAYQQDVPIVDTNLARLLYRLHGIKQPLPKNPARNRQLIAMAAALLPKGKAREFNLAALDLCALVCIARQPACAVCPLREECVQGRLATASG